MRERNPSRVHFRIAEKTKQFVDKKAKEFGSLRRYHMYLYEKDGLRITSKDL